ncbi:MAG: HupE/UreJ family protein [Myxococcota bacterium]
MIRAGLGLRWLAVAVLCLWATVASAHEFRPASLSLRVDAEGEVAVSFSPPPVTAQGVTTTALRPVPPAHCEEVSALRWSCGAAGLTGTLAMAGLETDPVDVLVHVRWSGEEQLHERLGPDRPSLRLARGMAVEGTQETASAYFVLGVEHILLGADHLLFVLTLLLLGGRPRDHLRTITAFTLGHAVALVVQTLHPMAVPGPWVEACITASIVVAAAEALRPSPQRASAWSWALGFGVLHGLGFAGALADLGLPPGSIVTALLSFNLGVEAGQLAVVLVALIVAAVVPLSVPRRQALRRGLAWAAGSIAVAWTLERIAGFGNWS